MHLCIDARMYHASGIGTYLQNLLPALADSFRLTLLGNPDELAAVDASVIPVQLPIYSVAELRHLPARVPPCDVFWSPHYNVPLLPIRARRRLVTIHDVFHLAYFRGLTLPQKLYARTVTTAATRLSHRIITVSEFSKSEIRQRLRIKADKITVIPNGVDHELFNVAHDAAVEQQVRHRYQLPETYVLYVGNVKPHKNLSTLVQAFAALPESSAAVHLVVVGKKEGFITEDTGLRELIDQHPSPASRVHFTGFVAQDDLPWLYRRAHLFVFPSYYEGFGLPPLEAMACGCPVLVSGRASMPEICAEAVSYFRPDRTGELTALLQQALAWSPIQRQRRIESGLARVQKYRWESAVAEHTALIRRLSA